MKDVQEGMELTRAAFDLVVKPGDPESRSVTLSSLQRNPICGTMAGKSSAIDKARCC